MKFNGLTNEGIKYLAKIQANQNAVTFSKIVIGDGRLDEHDNPAELTSLINKKTEKGIITKEQNGDTVTLLTYIDNVSLSQGYYPREIGIYVNDNGMEKLYYYMNDGDETSWIPPESYGPFKIELKLNIIASNANSIIVNNYAKSMYVTKEYVDALNSAKLDKGGYTGTAKSLDDRISSVNTAKADKTINITAGNGLTGGGDLTTNRTISVGATDDSVVVGAAGIKVNTYDGLDSTSTTRPLSANAGKLLNEKKLNLTGGFLTGELTIDNYKALRFKKTTGESVWAFGAGDDNKFYLGEINIPLRIRSSEATIDNLCINNNNPFLEFKNRNSRSGYIGFGSTSTDILQISNTTNDNNISSGINIYKNGSFVLPYVIINNIVDANTLIGSSARGSRMIYQIDSSSFLGANFPVSVSAGTLTVKVHHPILIEQEYTPHLTDLIYKRKRYNNVWSEWKISNLQYSQSIFTTVAGAGSYVNISSKTEVPLNIFKDKIGSEVNASYDSSSGGIKILKAGRYTINLKLYSANEDFVEQYVIKLKNNQKVLGYYENEKVIRNSITDTFTLDLEVNDVVLVTIQNVTNTSTTRFYKGLEFSRIELIAHSY